MNDSLWSRSADAPSADIPGGDVVEEAMRRSLEDNAYSVQGFWLWQARAIQQRRRREQGRRRPRGDQGSAASRSEADTAPEEGPRNEAERNAEQHAEEVRAYISALLHATGYPYREPSPVREAEAEELENAVLGGTRVDDGASAAAPATAVLDDSVSAEAPERAGLTRASVPTSDEAPLKAARTEANVPSRSAAPPKSALAKLVAKAKAQHRESAADTPVVTVVPAAKNPPFPEDISGVRTAYASSSTAGRKRVQFLDESPSPSSLPKASHTAGEGDSDDEEFGVQLPGVYTHSSAPQHGAGANEESNTGMGTAEGEAVTAKHPSQMTRAEFLSQFKRAPRRGEIGQSAEDIAAAEELGYVMSGSRSVASRMYVDRIQRQLHEHEATKLQQQFRKVEDERMDDQLVHGLAQFVMKKKTS